MFRNILVSVDGSPHSDRALREAVDIATGSNGRLTILSAVPKPATWAMTPATAGVVGSLANDIEDEFEAILRRALSQIPNSIPVTKILTHEPIRSALAHSVDDGNYDLLVMGSRGRSAISASLLGSVSHYALNHLNIPVLIVHADCTQTPITALPAVAVGSSA